MFSPVDQAMMQRAMTLAESARALEEVPVGAVLCNAAGEIIGEGANAPISMRDTTAHAEILALRAACQGLNNYRLPMTTLYVTLEPCAMCIGAILHARVARVVFGATDEKTGCCGSVTNLPGLGQLNHQTQVQGGLMAEECAEQLRAFFRERRALKKAEKKLAPYDSLTDQE